MSIEVDRELVAVFAPIITTRALTCHMMMYKKHVLAHMQENTLHKYPDMHHQC
jgi:hypothetical protein